MKPEHRKPTRCAVYTRVSTEFGLEQDFNSLDAQREASEAFIKSQAHEGWRLVPARYDDGGFSGASLERPALQLLLADVRARKIDVIVVYKVDRLTRSLADFAKLVELFDELRVSFVSVTQAFNTTSSMGRLTLNVLLSFAQFEREVTGERIRDKIAASKRKGIWMGGTVPLGYRVENRKLLIDEAEAATVRLIFNRYLELGSLPTLQADLRAKGIVSRARPLSSGRTRGGVPFTNGPLAHLLKNRVYLGELTHKDKSWPGEHSPIIAPEVFDAVQQKLAANLNAHHVRRDRSEALLLGRIFDDRGHRMTPTHARKGGARYRYYTSSVIAQGRRSEAGSVGRVPAPDVERVIIGALRERVAAEMRSAQASGSDEPGRWTTAVDLDERSLVRLLVQRVTIRPGTIEISLTTPSHVGQDASLEYHEGHGAEDAQLNSENDLVISWSTPSFRRRRELIAPEAAATSGQRPLRPEVRANVLRGIATAIKWREGLISGEVEGVAAIAEVAGRSERWARMVLGLALLAPDIVEAVVEGSLARGIGLTSLSDLPMDWNEQRRALGIPRGGAPLNRADTRDAQEWGG